MGIPGLLPFVRRACYEGNLADFSGQTILVDASCFIHRGLFGCAGKVAMGEDTHFYIGYVRKYVHFLLAQRCHVVLVFDGRPLPAKRGCNQARRESRRGYQQLGERLMSQGLTVEAERAFTRGTELTREVVERTIQAFNREHRVDVLVAPYEADAQIAYLMQKGLAHAVVTEDSDLIVYGCEKILFKLNPSNGACLVYDRQRLPNCLCPVLRRRFHFSTFRRICILAGCDYLQGGLQGVGLKGAEEIFAKTNQPELKTLLPRLPLYLGKRLRMKVDGDFVADYIKAENTFLHQIVFDPISKQQLPLNPYPASGTGNQANSFPFAGQVLSPQKAQRLALGNAECRLHLPALQDDFVLSLSIPEWSIWHEKYANLVERAQKEREKRMDERFGAFRPTKSPVKRPAAAPIRLSVSLTSATKEGEEDELLEPASMAKRRRLSEIQLTSGSPGNGNYAKWTSGDWLRKYGLDLDGREQKQGKEEEGTDSPSSAHNVSAASAETDVDDPFEALEGFTFG